MSLSGGRGRANRACICGSSYATAGLLLPCAGWVGELR